MLRINLLPPYIYDRSKRRNVTVLWVVILLAVIGGFVFAKVALDKKAADIAANTEREKPDQLAKQKAEQDATKIEGDNAALKAKTDFVKSTRTYVTDTYPPLFFNVRDYTIRPVVYSYLTPNGSQVDLGAYAPTLADVGHYVMAMQNNPNISRVDIGISSVPGFPVSDYARSQQAQGGGLGGAYGPPMGPGGPMAGIRGRSMGPAGMGGMGPGNPMAAQYAGRGGGVSGSPYGMGGGGGGAAANTGNIASPPNGGGHTFSVTLSLVKPIPPAPAYGAASQQQGGGMGMGMGPGGPPMMMMGPRAPGGMPSAAAPMPGGGGTGGKAGATE